jgi:hypothetical protein
MRAGNMFAAKVTFQQANVKDWMDAVIVAAWWGQLLGLTILKHFQQINYFNYSLSLFHLNNIFQRFLLSVILLEISITQMQKSR